MAVMADVLAPPLIVSEDLFLALVRENPDLRLERSKRGELIVMPPTGYRGSERNVELVRQLANWNKQHRLGRVTESNGGYRLPDSAFRAPDAAWVSAERDATIPANKRESLAPVCPDFVAELLSPSDDLNEIRAKMAEYVANGARLGWLLDPFRRAVEIYRPAREPEIREDAHTVDGESVLPGFTLDLDAVFTPD
jgi:Uma2 family endonuclease